MTYDLRTGDPAGLCAGGRGVFTHLQLRPSGRAAKFSRHRRHGKPSAVRRAAPPRDAGRGVSGLPGRDRAAVERGAADAAPEKDAVRRKAGRREAADDLVFDRGDAAAGAGRGAEQIRREPVSEHVFHRLCLFDDGRAALRGRPHGPRQQK